MSEHGDFSQAARLGNAERSLAQSKEPHGGGQDRRDRRILAITLAVIGVIVLAALVWVLSADPPTEGYRGLASGI